MGELLREIGMIARALDSISNVEFKDLELTKGQYIYLVRICENPGIIQEKLAELILVDRTTAARSIQKLEKAGFIEKRPDIVNKKIKKLHATAKGEATCPVILQEHAYSKGVALAGLSEEEQTQLHQLTKRVRENIEREWDFVKKGGTRHYLKE